MSVSIQPSPNKGVQINSLLRSTDAGQFRYKEADRELFEKHLRSFVPSVSFDAHAHLYDLRHLAPSSELDVAEASPQIDHGVLLRSMRSWMGDSVVADGLYFPFPARDLDCCAANEFVASAVKQRKGSRALMMIRPQDDPAAVESQLKQHKFAGFKVYHVFASRADTFACEQGEFLPEWAWELADLHELVIMMHMVLPTALSDRRNQIYIREHCLMYRGAKLVLAHAARAFNSSHTVDGIDSIRSLSNVFFDTSAVCEPTAFEAILRTFGSSRLMYGSDFPISEMRGRSISTGDGFFWLYDHNAQWSDWRHATPQLVGIESLLALKQACRTLHLNDSDVERIFSHNARQLLGIESVTGEGVQKLYHRAKSLIPGGTQLLSKRPEMFAPEQWPAYYEQAIGCEVIDTDGRRFIDMSHCGILSCILGFADPDVNAAVIRRIQLGNMATQQTADEVELAELLIEIHPWAEQARFTRCGGEAMAVAVRIARAATGCDKVAVCGYHGWQDWYLAANLKPEVENGFIAEKHDDDVERKLDAHLLPGLEPAGVPKGLAGTVHTFRYNRLDELDAALMNCGNDLAAIVMEPTRSVDPDPGFLEEVRHLANVKGVPLIFDEISSGWRYCLGGAHRLYNVTPDIAVFAKALANGFAMAAIIGRRQVMSAAQDSFISSTYWTEGVGPAAAVAAIKKMIRLDVPGHLSRLGARVMHGWRTLATKHGVPLTISGRPGSCSLSFDHPQKSALLTLLTTRMLERGFLAGASCSLTLAHEMFHVERYLEALDAVFGELAAAISADDVTDRLGGPIKHSTFSRLVD
jgi:glutamate-1-semialdehyde 2,1-aminomutase